MSSLFSLLGQFPKSVRSLLLVEFSERSSYYGYRSVLTIFLTSAALMLGVDNMTESEASALTHSNIALTYVMPILGGLLADWFFGRFATLLFFSIVCALGHGFLGAAFYHEQLGLADGLGVFTFGLSLIAIGAGGLKPNSTSLFADSIEQSKQAALLEQGFQAFYFAINLGSLLSFIVVPLVADTQGYEWAFSIPGILMAFTALVLFLNRKRYPKNKPLGYQPHNFVTLNLRALWLKVKGVNRPWQQLAAQYPESTKRVLTMWRIARFFVFFIMAWAAFDLNGADWTVDAKYLNRNLFGFEIPAGSIQTFNTIFVLLFVPLSLVFFNWLKTSHGRTFSTEKKVFFGMLLVAVSVAMEALIRIPIDAHIAVHGTIDAFPDADHNSGVSAGWQILVYAMLSAGEVLFSIGGLELGYRLGPPALKSTILSIFYLSTAGGNLFVQFLHTYREEGEMFSFLAGANLYWLIAVLLFLNALLFRQFLRWRDRQEVD